MDTGPGEMGTREAEKIARAMTNINRSNSPMRMGNGTIISIVGLMLNLATVIYFSGKLVSRLETVEHMQAENVQRIQQLTTDSVQHTVQIEVTKSKLSDIQSGIDDIKRTVAKK